MQNATLRTPEAGSPATWYGSAIHDVIEGVGKGLTDDEAIEAAWGAWGQHLEPTDLTLLKEDLAAHHVRDFKNVRLVLAEGEIMVPLTHTDDGREIWFRGRIDRLYESLEHPGHFIHVDYKSSKWQKTKDEVDEDPQLWAYNWLITEFYPEIDHLEQWLDQLRGGMEDTSKTDAQRDEIREWLAIEARKYFEVKELLEDGLPAPTKNRWCPWCPILESCQIVPHLSEWALSVIDALRPDDLKNTEDGQHLAAIVAVTPIDEYIDRYDDATAAIKILERYVDSVKAVVHEMPEGERDRLGFELRPRSSSSIPVYARRELSRVLGHDRFVELAKVTQESLKSIGDAEEREWALSLVEKRPGNKVIHRRR